MINDAPLEAAERIKRHGRTLGFASVGIARAEPMESEHEHLKEWLDRGYQASMGWMARTAEKRGDPRKVLPGARSIIATAFNYFTPVAHAGEPGTGKISRYAWGEDYHKVILEKLEAYARWITTTYPGCSALAYVDTGPLLEKAIAARAGIGWLGKHTNIISQEFGSWLFLGEVLTTLDLPADEPATDHCGSCTLCIDACPTDAIVAPYLVDSGKCISYLTIEHRGDLPADSPHDFSGWIFGCDICQDVCPWNEKFARPSSENRFLPRSGNEAPLLREWATMSRESFQANFAGSPIRRAKWDGLMRNIRIVLENEGETPPAS